MATAPKIEGGFEMREELPMILEVDTPARKPYKRIDAAGVEAKRAFEADIIDELRHEIMTGNIKSPSIIYSEMGSDLIDEELDRLRDAWLNQKLTPWQRTKAIFGWETPAQEDYYRFLDALEKRGIKY